MKKSEFIEQLCLMDKEMINKYISEKGKEPKLIPVIKFIN